MTSIEIEYQSEDFPSATIANGAAVLNTSWDDILWSAVTVGRPNRQYVFRHGLASSYEALFRWSLTRMAIEQRGPAGRRLRRTDAQRTLDPTEKGAVSYFLGMTFCKLFAASLLDTPWLLHLDVFRPLLDPVLRSRSRPDLVGQETATGNWHAFECKGRASKPNEDAKSKAKDQAGRLVSVNGVDCTLHIGAISYFYGDVLRFYWRDPKPKELKPIEIPEVGEAWRHYYHPIWEIIQRDPRIRFEDVGMFVSVEEADIDVSVHPMVARALRESQWNMARKLAIENLSQLREAGYKPDGIRIKAGASWNKRLEVSD